MILQKILEKKDFNDNEQKKISSFLNWLNSDDKKQYENEIKQIKENIKNIENIENIKLDIKEKEIIQITWATYKKIEKLENYNPIKQKMIIGIWKTEEEISKNFRDLILLAYLLVFQEWYTDVHCEITWKWELRLLWRINQWLEIITLNDIYNALKKQQQTLMVNFWITTNPDYNTKEKQNKAFDKIIITFLYIIAKIWLGYNPKYLLELFSELNVLIWNSSQSPVTHDVKTFLKMNEET